MKKSKTMRAASFLLVLTLMTSCFVGSTFAKYTSTATGSDTARVAKWSIEVNDIQIAVDSSPTVTFDLFETTIDSNVKEGTSTEAIIAPGTSGQFALIVENLSEVNAQYTIALTEANTGNIPLQYSVNGTEWKDSITELGMTELTNQAIAMGTGTDTRTVYWRWIFDNTVAGATGHAGQTNNTDTTLGIAGSEIVTIEATITVEQVD